MLDVQLPPNLVNVTGGTYATKTGILTLPVISNLASGASVAQPISYTMPAATAVTATATFTSTANDPVAGNNTSTLTTAQNRAPVASNVTTAPAILRTTTSQSPISPFDASASPETCTTSPALSSGVEACWWLRGRALCSSRTPTAMTSTT